MKKIIISLALILFSIVSTAQPVCRPGGIPQVAKWNFTRPQCFDSLIRLKYADTSKVAYVNSSGDLVTMTYGALLDSLGALAPDDDQDAFFFQRQQEANYIRNIAGISPTADTGLAEGQTAGINDSASLVVDSNISITSRLEAIALSSSGTGTLTSPYVIRNKFITLTSNDTCIIFNDPDADYYVTFRNIKAVGATTGSKAAYVNCPTRVIFEYCNFEGGNVSTSEGIHVASTAEVQVNNCLFPGYGGGGANYLDLLVNGNVQFTNCLFNHTRHDVSTSGSLVDLAASVRSAFVKFTNCNISGSRFQRIVLETGGATGTFEFNNTIIDITSANNIIAIQSANTASTIRMINCFIEYFGTSSGVIQTIAKNNYFRNVEIFSFISGNTHFIGSDESDNFFFDRIKCRSYGGVATEIILLTKAYNTTYSNVYIVASTGDGVEIINPLYNNYVYNIVCDSGTTEMVDLFRLTADSINPQYNNICHNIYGTPRVRGVQLTNVNGWTVSNIFIQSQTDREIFSISDSELNYGRFPQGNVFLGGTLPRKFIGNSLIVRVSGSPNPTLNSATWVDGDTIFVWNPSVKTLQWIYQLDTLSSSSFSLGPSTTYTGTKYIVSSQIGSSFTADIINVEDYLVDRMAQRLDSLNTAFTNYTATKFVAKADTNTIQAPTFTGSATQNAFNINQTWNGTGTFTGLALNITNTASGTASRPFNIVVGGTSEFAINTSGNLFWKSSAQPTFTWGTSIFMQARVGGTNSTVLYGAGTPIAFFSSTGVKIQGSVGTPPDAGVIFQVTSTNSTFKISPMTAAQASAITPSLGMFVVVSDTNGTFTQVGAWFYNGSAWVAIH